MRKLILLLLIILFVFSFVISAQEKPTLTQVEELLIQLHLSHVKIENLTAALREARNEIASEQMTAERLVVTPKREGWIYNWTDDEQGIIIGFEKEKI